MPSATKPICESNAAAVLLVARNYKVSASNGFGKAELRPVHTDTGCDPNLVREEQLPPWWRSYLLPKGEETHLHSASRTPIPVVGRIRMTVQLGTFTVRKVSLVVRALAVPCFLGTVYTKRYVKAIHCIDRVVYLLDVSSVSIQAVHWQGPNEDPPADPKARPAPSNKVRFARAMRIGPHLETEVWVQANVGGMSFLQGAAWTHLEKGVLMANGVQNPYLRNLSGSAS